MDQASFPFSERTATNYMRLAEVYGNKSEMVADLQLPAALLYRAASSSIPEADRPRLFAPGEDGSRPTEIVVQDRLRKVRWEQAERERQEREAKKNTPARLTREKRDREKRRQETGRGEAATGGEEPSHPRSNPSAREFACPKTRQ